MQALARALKLQLVGADRDGLVYSGTLDGRPLQVRQVPGPGGGWSLLVPGSGPWVLVARAELLAAPVATTSDAAFDARVGIARVDDLDALLLRLDPWARGCVADATALGAWFDPDGAHLGPGAVAALGSDPQRLLDAVHEVVVAVAALQEPSAAALAGRLGRDADAPEVERVVAQWVAKTLPSLASPARELVANAVIERSPRPDVLLAGVAGQSWLLGLQLERAQDLRPLVWAAIGAWRRGRDSGAVLTVACHLLAREGATELFWELWELPGLAAQQSAVEAVLEAAAARPEDCRDLLLTLRPVGAASLGRLVALLEALPGLPAVERLAALWALGPDAVGPALVRRAALALREQRVQEIERLLAQIRAHSGAALLEAALALPDDAGDIVAALRPAAEEDALCVVARLATARRSPAVEDALLGWLTGGGPRLKYAAALALATAGGPRSLPELDALASAWLVAGELRQAASKAAVAIRRRPEVGSLSIADLLPGGGLSPADDDVPPG
ncbi:MAG: hypothetical protein R3F59_35625 [Myxococcota bacterium]